MDELPAEAVSDVARPLDVTVAHPDRAIHRLETMEAWFERFDPAVESGEEHREL